MEVVRRKNEKLVGCFFNSSRSPTTRCARFSGRLVKVVTSLFQFSVSQTHHSRVNARVSMLSSLVYCLLVVYVNSFSNWSMRQIDRSQCISRAEKPAGNHNWYCNHLMAVGLTQLHRRFQSTATASVTNHFFSFVPVIPLASMPCSSVIVR